MKKVIILAFYLLASNILYSQIPHLINYQAVARDSAGNPATNENIVIRFSIRDSTSQGSILYTEIHTSSTNQFGMFNTKIGSGQVSSGNFASIPWASGDKFLQTEIDFGGGLIDMGAIQLVSVPYALVAGSTVESGNGGGNKIAINTTKTTVSGTTEETQLFSVLIPGGILGTNNAIRYKILGSNENISNGANNIIRVRYGNSLIGSIVLHTGIGSVPFEIEGYIIA